jgi:hypothetical protein
MDAIKKNSSIKRMIKKIIIKIMRTRFERTQMRIKLKENSNSMDYLK